MDSACVGIPPIDGLPSVYHAALICVVRKVLDLRVVRRVGSLTEAQQIYENGGCLLGVSGAPPIKENEIRRWFSPGPTLIDDVWNEYGVQYVSMVLGKPDPLQSAVSLIYIKLFKNGDDGSFSDQLLECIQITSEFMDKILVPETYKRTFEIAHLQKSVYELSRTLTNETDETVWKLQFDPLGVNVSYILNMIRNSHVRFIVYPQATSGLSRHGAIRARAYFNGTRAQLLDFNRAKSMMGDSLVYVRRDGIMGETLDIESALLLANLSLKYMPQPPVPFHLDEGLQGDLTLAD
jgi:hypothetical protein